MQTWKQWSVCWKVTHTKGEDANNGISPGVCLEIRTNSVITAERKQWPSIDNSSTIRLQNVVSLQTLPAVPCRRERTTERVPTSEESNLMAALREEPSSDEGSTAEEGVPSKGSGWVGSDPPMRVGVDYTARDMCDGQALPSPGRSPIASRRYPASPIWKAVTRKFEQLSAQCGTAELLMNLVLGRVQENPFSENDIQDLKQDVIDELERAGLELKREENDRRDIPTDFRYMDLLLKAAEDPEVGFGQFSQGVRVGPSVRMPRLPALYRPKRKWRLGAQEDPSIYLEEEASWPESWWRSNYPSLGEHTERVKKVLEDQTSRGQLIKLLEDEAKARYPNTLSQFGDRLLGCQSKGQTNGEILAHVLFDGTTGLQVITRTRLRDQE